jgi:hypothetical protein
LTESWRERDSSWDEATVQRVRELEAAARSAVKPVTHTLSITPVP